MDPLVPSGGQRASAFLTTAANHIMAGHSKWANIQHRKKAQDAKRGKVFTRLSREITVAARSGGDVESNPRLRLAVDKALAANMTKDAVERAIKKGAGGQDADRLEAARFEGYGPGGVAVMVDCLTDNRNRTVSEVRHAFTKHGGKLGTDGSVAFLFSERGVVSFPAENEEDTLLELALEAGADDVITNDDGSFDVLTAPEAYLDVKAHLEQAGLEPERAEVTQRPATSVRLESPDEAERMVRLFERLEELDDVQNVYSNADIDETVLAGIT